MQDLIFFWEWEEKLIVWLQQIGGEGGLRAFFVWLNNLFSFLGEEYVAIGVMGVVYWGLDKKKAERIGFAVVSSLVCNAMIKNRFKRLRPYLSSDKISLLREVEGYSFPSAHSSSATALYPTLAGEYKEHRFFRVIAVAIPLLIGASRCYLGAHWPTDVITGLLLGLLFFALSEFIMPRVKNKWVIYAAAVLIGGIGLFYCTTEDYFTNYGILIGFCSGMLFENRFVNFENTKNIPLVIIRTFMGGVCFFVLNLLFKALLGNIFPDESFGSCVIRTVRYAMAVFLIIGVYPMIFKPVEGFFAKKMSKKDR